MPSMMSVLTAFVALAPPVILGVSAMRLLGLTRSLSRWVAWPLTLAVGLSLSSVFLFWFRRPFMTVEWAAAVIGLICLRVIRPLPEPGSENEASAPRWYIRLALVFVTVTAGLHFLSVSAQHPHGGWDAFAIWNLHARVLMRGASDWAETLNSILFSNPDYPLLLPGLIVRFWRTLNFETPLVPAAIAMGFLFATLSLLYGFVRRLRGRAAAATAVFLLAGTPFFAAHAASQYADVPFAFFVIAAVGLLWFYEEDNQRAPGLLVLSGLHAGMAAWTKNEGILFLAALTAAYALSLMPWRIDGAFKRLAWFCAGAAPGLVTAMYFKMSLSVTDVLFSGQTSDGVWTRILDPDRHATIVSYFWAEIWRFGQWYFTPVPALLLLLLLHRFAPWKLAGTGLRTTLLTLAFVCSGYYAIYAVTPIPLTVHIGTSFNRLLLQLLPVVLMLCVVELGGPRRSGLATRWPLAAAAAVAVGSLVAVRAGAIPEPVGRPADGRFLTRAVEVGYFRLEPEAGGSPEVSTIIHSFLDGSSLTVRQPSMVTKASIDLGRVNWTQVGLALLNPGDQRQVITVEARVSGVREALRLPIPLAAGEQSVKLLSELFPQHLGSAQDTTLWLESVLPFSGLALRLPEAGFRQLPFHSEKSTAQGAAFPNVVMFGGWKTGIVLANLSKTVISGQLRFFTSDHREWRLRLNGNESDVFRYILQPGGTMRFDPEVPEAAP